MTPIILIPARMAATRLPGKPLADIEGTPMIVRALRQAGHEVLIAHDGREALARFTPGQGQALDVLVMDIGLPDSDGRDVVQALKSAGQHAPVLFLTALGATHDRLSGFAAGGEDYVVKPFEVKEVLARLDVLARRGPDRQLRFAPWQAGDPVEPNRHGIPEPARIERPLAPFQLDLVLVPLLAFDRRGQRLGYGGGWYDRSFAFLAEQQRPTEPLLVGVAYDFQEQDAIAPEAWDVALDFVATDRELIDCHAERQRETSA